LYNSIVEGLDWYWENDQTHNSDHPLFDARSLELTWYYGVDMLERKGPKDNGAQDVTKDLLKRKKQITRGHGSSF
jgi:hypothetical protein